MLVLTKKKKKKIDPFAWRREGQEKYDQLQQSFGTFKKQLQPYSFKKDLLAELTRISTELKGKYERNGFTFTHNLLNRIRPHSKKFNHKCKLFGFFFSMRLMFVVDSVAFLISEQLAVIQHLKKRSAPMSFEEEEKAHRIMSNSLYDMVPIPFESVLNLRSQVDRLKQAEARMKRIEDSREMCHKIPNCDSMLHKKPSGCPKCGVVYLGGTLNMTQYVRSVDRDSGTPTLVRLDFEMEILDQEKEDQEVEIEECKMSLESVRSRVFLRLLVDLQRWWNARLALIRVRKSSQKSVFSKFYYRIRRLSQMKRVVDSVCVADIDVSLVSLQFSELVPEVEEYVAKKQREINGIVERVARSFLSKLRTCVLKTRRRKMRKEQRENEIVEFSQSLIDKRLREKNLRILRKRVESIESRSWVCLRPECNNRKFLTADRYNTHMSIHKSKDATAASNQIIADAAEDVAIGIQFENRKSLVTGTDFSLRRIAETRAGIVEKMRSALTLHDQEAAVGDIVPSHFHDIPHIRSLTSTHVPLYFLEVLSKRSTVLLPRNATTFDLTSPITRIGTIDECEIAILFTRKSNQSQVMSQGSVDENKRSLDSFSRNASSHSPPSPPRGVSRSLSTSPKSPVLQPQKSSISRVHCLLFSPLSGQVLSAEDEESPAKLALTVVDNNSSSGTYVISGESNAMAVRVPVKASAGMVLNVGDLLCVGVGSAAEAAGLVESLAGSQSSLFASSTTSRINRSVPPPTLTALEASSAAVVFKVRIRDSNGH